MTHTDDGSRIACETIGVCQDVGAVVIGRNEGERLRRCLASLAGEASQLVYVDSGSSDGSVELALSLGAHVIPLDLAQPFTAARARNTGFRHLTQSATPPRYVQFVDGDCEVEAGWITAAQTYLMSHAEAGVVFGRRRERFPETSIYNRLCDLEWDIAPGECASCGGDAMMRVEALQSVGGYREDLIAGEEPELCVRLRQDGRKIVCLAQPMTIHDAAITRFSQWWRRAVRAGYSFAQGEHIHGGPPEHHKVVETRRAWIWGAGLPVAIIAGVGFFGPPALLLSLIYPAQVARLYLKRKKTMQYPFAASLFHVLGRFPEALGQLKFQRDLLTGRTGKLIEYK